MDEPVIVEVEVTEPSEAQLKLVVPYLNLAVVENPFGFILPDKVAVVLVWESEILLLSTIGAGITTETVTLAGQKY